MFTKLVSLFKRQVPLRLDQTAHRLGGTSELVRPGVGAARIQKITSESVEYTNEAGVDCIIDLTRSINREHGSAPFFL